MQGSAVPCVGGRWVSLGGAERGAFACQVGRVASSSPPPFRNIEKMARLCWGWSKGRSLAAVVLARRGWVGPSCVVVVRFPFM
jgi:hypothetical protein